MTHKISLYSGIIMWDGIHTAQGFLICWGHESLITSLIESLYTDSEAVTKHQVSILILLHPPCLMKEFDLVHQVKVTLFTIHKHTTNFKCPLYLYIDKTNSCMCAICPTTMMYYVVMWLCGYVVM